MSSLTSTFDECRKQPDGETLEQMRAHYFTDAIMNEKESPNTGGLNIPQAGAIEAITNRKKREKYAKDIAFAVKLMNDRLDALEDKLIEKYGEYFAENLAAEYLDDETYKQLMSIDDQDERRRQIAHEINKGIENGTIKYNSTNPDFKEWLDVNKQYEINEFEKTIQVNEEINQKQTLEKPVKEVHNIADGNEGNTFDSIFANKSPVTI